MKKFLLTILMINLLLMNSSVVLANSDTLCDPNYKNHIEKNRSDLSTMDSSKINTMIKKKKSVMPSKEEQDEAGQCLQITPLTMPKLVPEFKPEDLLSGLAGILKGLTDSVAGVASNAGDLFNALKAALAAIKAMTLGQGVPSISFNSLCTQVVDSGVDAGKAQIPMEMDKLSTEFDEIPYIEDPDVGLSNGSLSFDYNVDYGVDVDTDSMVSDLLSD